MKEKCLTESLVYKADINNNEENSKTKVYYGLSESPGKFFKKFKKIQVQKDACYALMRNLQSRLTKWSI